MEDARRHQVDGIEWRTGGSRALRGVSVVGSLDINNIFAFGAERRRTKVAANQGQQMDMVHQQPAERVAHNTHTIAELHAKVTSRVAKIPRFLCSVAEIPRF